MTGFVVLAAVASFVVGPNGTLVPAPPRPPATPAEHWCRHHVRRCRAKRPVLASHSLVWPVRPPHAIRARSVK